MAHLLMIESWLLSNGSLLPQAIKQSGHNYTFVCRDLNRYLNFPLSNGEHPAVALADHVAICDTNDIDILLQTAETLYKETPFQGVLTSCDCYLLQVAKIAEYLSLPGVSSASVKIANNKSMMREAMRRAGLPGPQFGLAQNVDEVHTVAADIGYPLIIKPSDLYGSLLVRQVENGQELERAFLEISAYNINARGQTCNSPVLLESILSGTEYSVESLTIAGQTHIIGITDKQLCGQPYFIESGHMFPAKMDDDTQSQVTELVSSALIAVGYDHGVAHTEIKLTTAGPRVIEINTRAAGNWINELIKRVNGISLMDCVIRLALGEDIDLATNSQGISSAAIRFILAEREGELRSIDGWEAIQQHPQRVDGLLRPDLNGRHVRRPENNDDYLGFIMCVDETGMAAADIAENLVSGLTLRYADASEPVSV